MARISFLSGNTLYSHNFQEYDPSILAYYPLLDGYYGNVVANVSHTNTNLTIGGTSASTFTSITDRTGLHQAVYTPNGFGANLVIPKAFNEIPATSGISNTITFWFRPETTIVGAGDNSYRTIFAPEANSTIRLLHQRANGLFRLERTTGVVQTAYGSTTPTINNTWNHIAIVETSAYTYKFYINGVFNIERTITSDVNRNFGTITMLMYCQNNSIQYPFIGGLSEFILWNRELSAAEILAVKNDTFRTTINLNGNSNWFANSFDEVNTGTSLQMNSGGTIFANINEVGITNGLVAYYPFNYTTRNMVPGGPQPTNSILVDYTDTNWTSNIAARTTTLCDSIHNCCHFQLNHGGMSLGGTNFLMNLNDASLSFWYYGATVSSSVKYIIVKGGQYRIGCNIGTPQSLFVQWAKVAGDTIIYTSSTATTYIGSWNMVSVVFNRASTMNYYVNEVLEGTADISPEVAKNQNASGDMRIGFNGTGTEIQGVLKDFRIYNRALSQAEITTLYQNYKIRI